MRRSPDHNRKISAATRGENHWRTKLEDDVVQAIYAHRGKETAMAISVRLAFEDIAVSIGQIYSIWSGRTWSHVTGAHRT